MKEYLNKQLKNMYNVTEDDYRKWCDKYKRNLSSETSKSKFFFDLRRNKLIRFTDGSLDYKNRR